uniref:Ef-hand domain-containing thioredoxin n=1 Tax=Tetraselmis sp. GSL018 TaxID=582737 RepID=A0A061SGG2_9CHLO
MFRVSICRTVDRARLPGLQHRAQTCSLQRVSSSHPTLHFRKTSVAIPAAPDQNSSSEYEAIDSGNNRRLADYVQLFKAADTDGNGKLDKEELHTVLESFEGGKESSLQNWLPNDEMERILLEYDADKSGDITIDEFTSMMQDRIILEGKLEEYEAAFRAVDTSGNGTVGATEIAELFDSIGQPMSYMQLFRVMEKYDKDGSGQIDFKEFLNMFRDQLLDLQDILDYVKISSAESTSAPSEPRLISVDPGSVALIFSGEELDDIMESNPGRVVVVMASLTWCRPCKGFQRTFQRFADVYKECRFVKFYGNSNEKTKALFKDRLRVKGTPWFFLFRDGEEVGGSQGSNKSRLEENLRSVLREDELPEQTVAS